MTSISPSWRNPRLRCEVSDCEVQVEHVGFGVRGGLVLAVDVQSGSSSSDARPIETWSAFFWSRAAGRFEKMESRTGKVQGGVGNVS